MANGEVCSPYYKNGGKYRQPGLRNKRKAHWARIREMERIVEERKARAVERSQRDFEQQYEGSYGGYSDAD